MSICLSLQYFSVGGSTTLAQNKIAQQQLDGLKLMDEKDVHGPQRKNPNDFGDPLTFLIAPL